MILPASTAASSFNSRTREGCDDDLNSTLRYVVCFNSRTREGCDGATTSLLEINLTFQFTHPGGVRRVLSSEVSNAEKVSIHAPGRGAT